MTGFEPLVVAGADADATAADWLRATEIETPARFDCAADQVLGAGLTADARADFSPSPLTAATHVWRMRDVTYLRSPGRAYHDGAEVAATYRDVFDADPATIARLLAGPHRRLGGGRLFCATNRFSGNHYHLVVELIPAVAAYAVDPGFAGGALLGPPQAAVPMLRAGLALAGITPPALLPPDPSLPLDIQDLTYCTLLNGWAGPSLFSRAVYDRMVAAALAEAAPGMTGERSRMIYVWRADSPGRPMRNEDLLVERLCGLGVEPVLLTGLSLSEQIRLFRDAKLVIGPHGAGLANVVFARPGAVLYELLPSHYTVPHMARLAQLRGLHYWCDVHPAEVAPGLWRHAVPWSVDIDDVLARVAAIQALYRLG